MKDLKNKVLNLVRSSQPLKKRFTEEEMVRLQELIPWAEIGSMSLKELKHCLEENITEKPVCIVCGKDVAFRRKGRGAYATFCSNNCRLSEKGSELWRAKTPAKDPKVVEKMKKTNLERYGTECTLQNEEVNSKARATCIEKYGHEYAMQNDSVLQRKNETMIERYGEAVPLKNKSIHNKFKETIQEKYNCENLGKFPMVRRNMVHSWDSLIMKLSMKNLEPLFTLDDYLKGKKRLSFRCQKCNNEIETPTMEVSEINCVNHATVFTGVYEIKEFIESLDPNINVEVKSETTLRLPEMNIEIDFLHPYWCSTLFLKSDLLEKRSYNCDNEGIQLFQIFETEWVHKKDIVKSILETHLGFYTKHIDPKECTVRPLLDHEYITFCEINHIEGFAPAQIKIGLFAAEELVYVFGAKEEAGELIIIRECPKLNYKIEGLSKMLEYLNVLSYPNISLTQSKRFPKNVPEGFTHFSGIIPSDFYVKYDGSVSNFYVGSLWTEDQLDSRGTEEKFKKSTRIYLLEKGYLQIVDSGRRLFERKLN